MELNRDQIIKALECCLDFNCTECPMNYGDCEERDFEGIARRAIVSIKELTEENKTLLIKFQAMKGAANSYKTHCEKLSEEIFNAFERGQNQAKADTVRKIKTQVHNKAIYPSTKGDVAYISLKAFDALADGLISDKN